ncbi:uncharacterized protein O3C94_018323 [Discoglossus pictus]
MMDNDLDEDTKKPGADKTRKHEPFKRKHRIKTSKPAEKQESVEITTTITPIVTVTNEENKEDEVKNDEEGNVDTEQDKEAKKEEEKNEEVNKVEDLNKNEMGKEQATNEKPTENKTIETNEVKETPIVKGALGNTAEISLPPAKGGLTPRKGAPKFKQRQTKQFKSKPPKRGVIGFGDDIPGMDGLGTDITVICPWEAFSHLELHELAQFGII